MFNWRKNKTVITDNKSIIPLFPNKGNVLIKSLKTAISALEKGIVMYDWHTQSSCNCGVVVQALTDSDTKTVNILFDKARMCIPNVNKNNFLTWREVAQQNCSVTGKPLHEVFELLVSYGLKMEDIVHLEYMNNKAIIEVSGIDILDKDYYTKKSNLISYLKAWVKILENKIDTINFTDKGKLESELLVAVNEEKYEEAANLRDRLAEIV